ncbi:MAG: methionyl-tRNA formyltransferase [Acidimicrobiia bacterium]
MRLVYFGTPVAAVGPLDALVDAGHEIALVVTQPDRRRGRGKDLVASPVKVAALRHGLTVVTPTRTREIVDQVRDVGADLGIVVAFGQILPQALLDAIPGGLVNVHYSLLPRWRGAAPVERAILAGDAETGVDIMAVDLSLDTGAIYAEARVTIGGTETAGELHARLNVLGTDLLVRTLPQVSTMTPTPQVGEPTYAEKLTVAEFELDLAGPVDHNLRLVRAGNPRPGAWLAFEGDRLKVWQAHVEDDRFVPDSVQPQGKKPMEYAAWRTGLRRDDPFA